MRSSLSAIVMVLVVATSAYSQDIAPLKRTIDGLPKPVTVEQLAELSIKQPNTYVYFVQDFLAERGTFTGTPDGQLKSGTIGALLTYCRERGIEPACAGGPLLPKAVAAVAGAIVTDLVPVLPEGWRIADNGKGGSIGLTTEVVSAGPSEAVLHFSGTAAREGYINIELSPLQASMPGNWVTSVTARGEQNGKYAGDLWLRTAILDPTGYVGELFDGTRLPEGEQAERISASGAPKDGATQMLPYIQFWLRAGQQIDTTLTLADPSFARQ